MQVIVAPTKVFEASRVCRIVKNDTIAKSIVSSRISSRITAGGPRPVNSGRVIAGTDNSSPGYRAIAKTSADTGVPRWCGSGSCTVKMMKVIVTCSLTSDHKQQATSCQCRTSFSFSSRPAQTSARSACVPKHTEWSPSCR